MRLLRRFESRHALCVRNGAQRKFQTKIVNKI